MLLLVLTHRHIVRLIQQNIRRHQGRVGEEAAVDVVGILGALVLELGHAAQLAEHGVAVEDPAQLRVLMDMALDKQGVLLRVQAAGDVLGQLGHGAPAQLRRVLPHGDAVQVRHEIVAVKFLRQGRPVLHRAQIVAQVQVAGGLDAGEHYFFRSCVFHINYLCVQFCLLFSQVFLLYQIKSRLTTGKI